MKAICQVEITIKRVKYAEAIIHCIKQWLLGLQTVTFSSFLWNDNLQLAQSKGLL